MEISDGMEQFLARTGIVFLFFRKFFCIPRIAWAGVYFFSSYSHSFPHVTITFTLLPQPPFSSPFLLSLFSLGYFLRFHDREKQEPGVEKKVGVGGREPEGWNGQPGQL
jgi:hypothetical protein